MKTLPSFNSKGQSLPEVLVSLAVAVVVIGALIVGVSTSIRSASFAQDQVQATKLAQDALEKVRAARDRDAQLQLSSGTKSFSQFIGDSSDCAPTCYFTLVNETSASVTLHQETSSSNSIVGISGTTFQRQIKAVNRTANQKTFTARIIWTDGTGSHESNLETILTNQ